MPNCFLKYAISKDALISDSLVTKWDNQVVAVFLGSTVPLANPVKYLSYVSVGWEERRDGGKRLVLVIRVFVFNGSWEEGRVSVGRRS